jgi:protein TonB
MSSYAHPGPSPQKLGSGFVSAVLLHAAIAAALIGFASLHPPASNRWGEKSSSVGAIQASMVSSIPLPTQAPPVEHAVLTSENVSKAPAPPPVEKTAPPPRPTDLLIKNKVDQKPLTKVAPLETFNPIHHPQPVPDTPKARMGDAATQLPHSATPVQNGTATATVQDRAFGSRYAYYVAIVGRMVAQNWYTREADPATSQGKRVVLIFDIERDGTVANLRTEARSGSPSLDTSALRALQRIDTFGPLPAGDHITVEYTFDYRQP